MSQREEPPAGGLFFFVGLVRMVSGKTRRYKFESYDDGDRIVLKVSGTTGGNGRNIKKIMSHSILRTINERFFLISLDFMFWPEC
jgi:hypothetical protein